MKNIKKILALLVAVLMIAVSMGALAADGDITPDTPIKITGLEEGDQVTLYKVIKWTDGGVGWEPAAGFEALREYEDDGKTVKADCPFAKIVGGTLGEAEVKAITDIINGSPKPTAVSGSPFDVGSDKTFEKTIAAGEAGMYIALIKPAKAGTMYNPIVVSSNYGGSEGNNEIDSSEKLGALAKKDTTTVTKTATEYDHDAGDEVTFTITTTIPTYADVYTDPFFNVSDKLSTGLVLIPSSITVTTDPVVASTVKDTANDKFTVEFDSAGIKALETPSAVTITYKATLTTDAPTNVNEENNTVTVEYSNNPNDKTGKGVLKDGTNHYTFDLDGTVFGNSSYRTGELVKVGKDANGSDILAMKELSNESSHSALEGATFGLYTDEACTKPYKNKIGDTEYTWDHITSDANGLMGMDGMTGIKGLDAGKYYFKEISAPAGYIKDTRTYTIEITTVVEDVDVTETVEGQTVTYKVPTLKSYKVTVNGAESSYTMTLSGPAVSKVTPADSSTEIVNTKGVELPSTGGVGTTIFYIGGSILVLAAVILLVTKRRMSAGE